MHYCAAERIQDILVPEAKHSNCSSPSIVVKIVTDRLLPLKGNSSVEEHLLCIQMFPGLVPNISSYEWERPLSELCRATSQVYTILDYMAQRSDSVLYTCKSLMHTSIMCL